MRSFSGLWFGICICYRPEITSYGGLRAICYALLRLRKPDAQRARRAVQAFQRNCAKDRYPTIRANALQIARDGRNRAVLHGSASRLFGRAAPDAIEFARRATPLLPQPSCG